MVYHDLVGHYNAYFNAKEKLKAVYATLDKLHKDNYKDVISLYTYSNPKEGTTVAADLDDLEKRVTYSVQVHKVSNWADDDFLIMGKSNYIKGNYDKAQSFLKYTTTEYKNGVDYVKERKKEGKIARPTLKKKPVKKPKFEQVLDSTGNLVLKKIDERPSYTWLIHEPARAEALVWLAKTYGAMGKYPEATAVIQYMRSDDKFYKNLDKDVEATEAEVLLRQKNYHDAVKPLEKFLTMTKRKSERVRPLFILGQIYEMQGNYSKASEYYKEVLKNRPSYDMEFYAKIRRAKLGSKSGSSEEIKKLLVQMSRDGKYKDFLDQIYYELGQIVLNENNRAEARKDFNKSIASSTKNTDQRALSYLQLASMDYEDEAYVSSKFYYDSTKQNMAKTDTAFARVETRDKTLDKLVKQITIINTEDSLQRIANMSASDRHKFLTKLLDAKQKEADDKAAEKEKGKSSSMNADFIKPGGGAGALGGTGDDAASTFYFYNTTSRANGYAEFTKKWGRRKLEDNWRRKDKAANDVVEVDSTKNKQNAEDSANAAAPGSKEEKLIAGLPMTPEKMDKSNDKLIDAFYAMGTVYKDDLQAYRKSINAYEELNRRFPKNKLELESFYQLYLLYNKVKNPAKADTYKDQILANYPESTIAKYLRDPNYLVEAQKKENSLSTYYASAYDDYANGMYASAEKKVLEVDAQYKENKLRAKFDLLNAQILSKENRLGDYVQSLNKIISKYPGTAEKDQAQVWLDKLNHSKLPQVDISKLPKDSLDAAAAMANAPIFVDTTGNSDFLKKIAASRPKVSGDNATTAKVPDTAPKPGSKPAAKDTTPVKPYVPLTKAEQIDSARKAEKAAQDSAIAHTIAARKAKQDSIATLIIAKKAAQDSAIARNIAARKARQDSIAAVMVARKAAQDSAIARNIAAKKAIQDSIAAAKAAKTNAKAGVAGTKAAGNPAQDSINAKIAARKALQDSIAAKNLAAKKATQDAIDARIAAQKAKQDSINAKNLAAKKAAQEAIDARIAAKKAIQDSINGKNAAAQKAKQDSIAAKSGLKVTAKDTIPKKAVTPKLSAKDSIAAVRLAKTKDSLMALKSPRDAAQQRLKERRDSMIAANAAKNAATKPKDGAAQTQLTLQQRRDSMLAANAAKGSAATKPKDAAAQAQARLQERRDSMLAAKAVKDSLAKIAAKKPVVKEQPKPKTAVKEQEVKKPVTSAKTTGKDTVATKPAPKVAAAPRPAFDSDTTTEIYGKSDNAPHNVVIYFLDPSAIANAPMSKLDAFNAASFEANKLTTRTVAMDKDNNLINIKPFKNKDDAMAYVAALKAKMKEVMPALGDDQYFIGAISSLNYSTLISTKKINNYRHFYRVNYK
jgi:tetratricopeptide (TPR) repeat protein